MPLTRPSGPRPVHLAESQVMGRNAVAAVVALIQPTAISQFAGVAQGSESLDALGIPHLADAWAGAMILAGLAMVASYLLPRPDDTRVLEIAANVLVVLVSGIHLGAVLHETGWSGASWVSALDTSLIINCGGRSVFLARQIWWVSHRERRRG